jgi:tetratricopeptide (TPR) repeat protein
VAAILNELAGIYHLQKRLPEAERHYKRSIAVLEKALGADHPALEVALNGLVVLYQTQGRTKEAEAATSRSVALANTRYRGQAVGPMVVQQRGR